MTLSNQRSAPAFLATFGGFLIVGLLASPLSIGGQDLRDVGHGPPHQKQPENDVSETAGALPSIHVYEPSGRATYLLFSFSEKFRAVFSLVNRPEGKLLTVSSTEQWPLAQRNSGTTGTPGLVGICIGPDDPEESLGPDRVYPDLPTGSTGSAGGGLAFATVVGVSANTDSITDGPILAVLDSGIDFEHPELRNPVNITYPGLCFTTTYPLLRASCVCRPALATDKDPMDIEGCWPGPTPAGLPVGGEKCDSAMSWCDHGTHTAGHAVLLDVDGGAGLRILPVQVNSKFDNPGFCHDPGPCVLSFESDRIRALHWLYLEAMRPAGTKVSAVYLGQSAGAYRSVDECRQAHPCMQIAVDNLWSVGIPVIAPVGNDYRRDALGAPACLENVISVGASQGSDEVAFFTNAAANDDASAGVSGVPEHRFFDFVAPGVEIETSMPCVDGTCHARISGTSMAAAHVAAAWVRLKVVCGADRPEVVLQALRSLSRQKLTDSRGERPGATDIPQVDVRTIDWDNAPEHCENALNH